MKLKAYFERLAAGVLGHVVGKLQGVAVFNGGKELIAAQCAEARNEDGAETPVRSNLRNSLYSELRRNSQGLAIRLNTRRVYAVVTGACFVD